MNRPAQTPDDRRGGTPAGAIGAAAVAATPEGA